jgi:hypothetical protein
MQFRQVDELFPLAGYAETAYPIFRGQAGGWPSRTATNPREENAKALLSPSRNPDLWLAPENLDQSVRTGSGEQSPGPPG